MTANDLKLYHSATSPNSRRVRIFLAEKGRYGAFGTGRVSAKVSKTPRPTVLSIRDDLCPHSAWWMAARSVTRIRDPGLEAHI